jgi:predicted ATPase/DNA-binding XRE family transcriptional regulator
MPSSDSSISMDSFATFGDLLKYLRRRARRTQREVAVAVGYSEAQISRLEQNKRPPDLTALSALLIPALYIEDEPEIVARLIELAAQARGEEFPQGVVTFSRPTRKEVLEDVRSVEDNILNNLPLQLTSFVGREREIAEIKNLLGKARLITLTGSGGCGKTRLALETARQLVESYQDGTWLIELAPISDSTHIPQAFLTSLGLPEPREDSPSAALRKSLREKHLLLIADNCEHVRLETAKLIQEILVSCPRVQVIATSREILNIPGEVRFRVPSLSVSNEADAESVKLFVDRARTIFPAFDLTKDNVPHVAQICRRLDGIPLAIELAAARMTVLSVQQIAARLEHSFQLLSGGSETMARHQTLQATIDWSYDLLSETERALMRRLSVFSGGWILAAAEAVASDSSLIPVENVLDLHSQLVNKSLVIVKWESQGEARYTMLQTIRDFAREKLRTTGEMDDMRERHFDYFHALFKKEEANLFVNERSIDQAEREIDNLRATLAWTLEKDATGSLSEERAGRGLELIFHVWPLWLYRGYFSEGNEWIRQLLLVHDAPTPARARALTLAADFARYRGDYTVQLGLIEESLALSRRLGDRKQIAAALMEMGLLMRDLGHYTEAIGFLTDSLTLFQELKENLWDFRTSFWLAEAYMANGNLEAGRPLWKHGLELCQAENDQWHIAWGLEGLGIVARLDGRLEEARQLHTESLNLKVSVMDKAGIAYALEAFAQLASAADQFPRSALLWGAAEGLRQSLNLFQLPSRDSLYKSLIPTVREKMGNESFEETWTKGKSMSMDEAIKYAMTLPDS